jgi:uncharacterized protein YndB with AHSA1/START domain
MTRVDPIEPYFQPLRRSAIVARPPAEAFAIFTERFGEWWPRDRFSIHQVDALSCGLEPRPGGEIFECARDGSRHVWGTILTWDPPRRLVASWHPGQPVESAQELEVRFVAVPEGTRVELEHRGWQKLGADAAETRTSYEGGWAVVLGRCYVEACS